MNGSWWATDVRDLMADAFGGGHATVDRDRAPSSSAAVVPMLHLAGDLVLGRALAGAALAKAPLALAAFPALLLGGAAVAAAAYLSSRT